MGVCESVCVWRGTEGGGWGGGVLYSRQASFEAEQKMTHDSSLIQCATVFSSSFPLYLMFAALLQMKRLTSLATFSISSSATHCFSAVSTLPYLPLVFPSPCSLLPSSSHWPALSILAGGTDFDKD